MRLLRTDTAELSMEEFNESNLPPYAILSHTWEREEVTFFDLQQITTATRSKKGYRKLKAFCAQAQARSFRYGWVDTCCINKDSTTELGEAINSMYRWYKIAEICFVYLADFDDDKCHLEKCRWFKRGWTLQELIAPDDILFFTKYWTVLGRKSRMIPHLSEITGIEEIVLAGESPEVCSVAQRMSWAAGRETERPEDRAYSLLGLFDVSLPMIYGTSETRNAFILLQEEIIKTSTDQTIFAWNQGFPLHRRGHLGLLATSPDAFIQCHDVVQSRNSGFNPSGYAFTNAGLSLTTLTMPYAMNTYLAILDCTHKNDHDYKYGILVEELEDSNQYARVQIKGKSRATVPRDLLDHPDCIERRICVQQKPGQPLNRRYGFWVRHFELPGYSQRELRQARIWSRAPAMYNPVEGYILDMLPGSSGTAGFIHMPTPDRSSKWWWIRWLKFGFDADFNPVCLMGNESTLWGPTPLNLAPSRSAIGDAASIYPVHDTVFRSDWTRIRPHRPDEDCRSWDGTCILKGNKDFEYSHTLVALDLQISFKPCDIEAPLDRRNSTSLERWQIWTVDIVPLCSQRSPDLVRQTSLAKDRSEKVTRNLILFAPIAMPIAVVACGVAYSKWKHRNIRD